MDVMKQIKVARRLRTVLKVILYIGILIASGASIAMICREKDLAAIFYLFVAYGCWVAVQEVKKL